MKAFVVFASSLLALSIPLAVSASGLGDDLPGPRGIAAWRRDDGASGDGGCDPCADSCETGKRDDFPDIPRMLHGNDTSPWDDGEGLRWRKIETTDGVGKILIAYNLEFDCNTIPEVCNNMCYGVFCKKFSFTWGLTIQRDNVATCQAARKNNACGSSNPNYCSAKTGFPSGYSCDEYPFASTKQGQTIGNAATRCVPKGQNSSQGGKISGLYKNGQGTGRLADGTSFTIVLDNAGSSPNCGGYGGQGTKNCNKGTSTAGKTQR